MESEPAAEEAVPPQEIPEAEAEAGPSEPGSAAQPRRRGRRRPRPLDAATASAIAGQLVDSGLDEVWVQRLIVEAAAYHAPFADGDLRRATRRALAWSLPQPPAPPAGGARVAFVGPGGSGKTRLTAALAAVLGRGSTMPVSAISLAGKAQGRHLAALLEHHALPASTPTTIKAAAKTIKRSSESGVVVVDTPPLSAADPQATAELAEDLAGLELDVVYLALPAGLSAPAARHLIEAAAPLRPTAIAITHVDETSEIGEIVQAATEAGLPIALLGGGPDLLSSLKAMDQTSLAEWLVA